MIEITDLLKKYRIDESEIQNFLNEGEPMDAVILIHRKSDLNFLNSNKLVEAIINREKFFTLDTKVKEINLSVKMTNIDGLVSVTLKRKDEPERIILPDDPEWNKVKENLNNAPELLEYEKYFFEDKKHSKNQSKLFINGDTSRFWKTGIMILATLVIFYLVFFN